MQTNYKYQPNFNLILDIPPEKVTIQRTNILVNQIFAIMMFAKK